ncbi:MAG: hypothetical protein AAGB24_00955 [Bacteroidota bacterium]
MQQIFDLSNLGKKQEGAGFFNADSSIKHAVYGVFINEIVIGERQIMSTNGTQQLLSSR